jgi:hypothetical protein
MLIELVPVEWLEGVRRQMPERPGYQWSSCLQKIWTAGLPDGVFFWGGGVVSNTLYVSSFLADRFYSFRAHHPLTRMSGSSLHKNGLWLLSQMAVSQENNCLQLFFSARLKLHAHNRMSFLSIAQNAAKPIICIN